MNTSNTVNYAYTDFLALQIVNKDMQQLLFINIESNSKLILKWILCENIENI